MRLTTKTVALRSARSEVVKLSTRAVPIESDASLESADHAGAGGMLDPGVVH
jgi:hypothetical protein